jgi:hypothetical protein
MKRRKEFSSPRKLQKQKSETGVENVGLKEKKRKDGVDGR